MKKIGRLLITVLLVCTALLPVGTASADEVTGLPEDEVLAQPQPEDEILADDPEEIETLADGTEKIEILASTLSEGSLAIVVGVACLAVGLVGGLLLGKKKKTSNS